MLTLSAVFETYIVRKFLSVQSSFVRVSGTDWSSFSNFHSTWRQIQAIHNQFFLHKLCINYTTFILSIIKLAKFRFERRVFCWKEERAKMQRTRFFTTVFE